MRFLCGLWDIKGFMPQLPLSQQVCCHINKKGSLFIYLSLGHQLVSGNTSVGACCWESCNSRCSYWLEGPGCWSNKSSSSRAALSSRIHHWWQRPLRWTEDQPGWSTATLICTSVEVNKTCCNFKDTEKKHWTTVNAFTTVTNFKLIQTPKSWEMIGYQSQQPLLTGRGVQILSCRVAVLQVLPWVYTVQVLQFY